MKVKPNRNKAVCTAIRKAKSDTRTRNWGAQNRESRPALAAVRDSMPEPKTLELEFRSAKVNPPISPFSLWVSAARSTLS
jgi:hypothetical protein